MNKLYSRYFPTPAYLAMTSCALDISDQSIKYGELIATPHGLRLGRYGQEKIPAGVIVSGKIESEERLVQILKDLSAREHLHFVRVSLPEEQMYLFTLSLPKTITDLRETILLQIEEHIPLSAIDTVFDFNIISENTQTMLVEVLAVATSIIESYLSVFKKAGLVPISFELEAQAIARAVIPHDDMSSVMIVDFGETRTGVSIASGGRVLFTTTLDIGGTTLTNMIAKNFSLSFEKAEEMKRTYKLDGNTNIDDIFPIILNGISVLRDELSKQYTYWKNHDDHNTDHADINRIILCGGDANLSGLADYLEASMKVKVENANAWINISDMSISIPDMSFEESFGYATVLGLALADYTNNRTIINVLPIEEKKALKKEYWFRFATMILSLIAVFGIIATILSFPSYLFSVSKLTFAESRLEAFNTENPDIATNDLNVTINDINNKLILLSDKDSGISVSDRILSDITENTPKGITVGSILYTEKDVKNKTLEIHGIATDRTTLRNYKSTLLATADIASVDVPISDFLERSNINFTVSIILK